MERYDPAESWPVDVDRAALVARVRNEIEHGGTDRRNMLLDDLLCAAWPTRAAQDQ